MLFNCNLTYHSDTHKNTTPPTTAHTSNLSTNKSPSNEVKQHISSPTTSSSSTQKQEVTPTTTTPSSLQSPPSSNAATVVNQHNADFATRVTDITSLDMKVVPPLYAWLDILLYVLLMNASRI
jgi:hypothetical protein